MNGAAEPRAIRTALVTGAGGFIGGHLTQNLRRAGVRVHALVRDPARAEWLKDAGAELIRADITVPASLPGALAGVDTVFHCAALVTGRSAPPSAFESVNVLGTRHVLDACRREPGVERVVHLSSVAVFGHLHRGEVASERHALRAEGSYGLSKLGAEQVAAEAQAASLPLVIARPMWVYGWRSPGVVKLYNLIARGRMVLIGGGRNAIQPLAVEDLVEGLVRCATVAGVEGEIFNLAGPTAITTGQLCRDIAAALEVPPPRLNLPLPLARLAAGLCERFYPRVLGRAPIDPQKLSFFATEHAYSIAKARGELGWEPQTAFAAGAAQVARELRQRGLLA